MKNNEWSNSNGQEYSMAINFNKFKPSIINSIPVSKAGKYLSRVELIDSLDGVTLLDYFTTQELQSGDELQFITMPNSKIEKIRFYILTSTPDADYVYQKVLTDFPESIDFFEPEMELNATNEQFDFNVSNTNNFSHIEYKGGRLNLSSWKIYQKESSGTYSLPNFPEDLLDKYKNLENITDPKIVKLHGYKIDGVRHFDNENFNYPNCVDFTRKTITVEL